MLGVTLAMALSPLPAEAHLESTGLGPLYDGVAHFLLSPEDLVPVLALALFAGLRGSAQGRRTLLVLPFAWLSGGCIGLVAGANERPGLASVSFLLVGALLAGDARLSLAATTVLATLLGLVHGYLNGATMGQPGGDAVSLLGLGLAIFVVVALAAALVVQLQSTWGRIAVRVVGSWTVAIGMLMLGWMLRLSYQR
jgi:hydrogenase/urease accessory protein HupE